VIISGAPCAGRSWRSAHDPGHRLARHAAALASQVDGKHRRARVGGDPGGESHPPEQAPRRPVARSSRALDMVPPCLGQRACRAALGRGQEPHRAMALCRRRHGAASIALRGADPLGARRHSHARHAGHPCAAARDTDAADPHRRRRSDRFRIRESLRSAWRQHHRSVVGSRRDRTEAGRDPARVAAEARLAGDRRLGRSQALPRGDDPLDQSRDGSRQDRHANGARRQRRGAAASLAKRPRPQRRRGPDLRPQSRRAEWSPRRL